MIPLVHIPQTLRILVVLFALAVPAFWALPIAGAKRRLARALAALAFALPLLGIYLWGWSADPGLGVRVTWCSLVVLVPLVVSLWPAALLARLSLLVGRRAPSSTRAPSPPAGPALVSRRALLQGGAASLPLGAVAAGGMGLSGTSAPQRIPLVRMRYPDLHPDLVGLKILQLSDLHLGVALHTADLEALLVRASALAPDLIVLTGDVADDLDELEKALALLDRFRPRLGVYACIGNHEYLHDIALTRPIYDESPVPLLLGTGTTLTVGRARLYLAGADDPNREGDLRAFLDESVARCAEGAEGDFKLLLCHRPEGFVPAAKHGFDLTLSGHTHGGQLGVFGRSVFEKLMPQHFPWGPYQRGRSRLYTTSGFGHWFPFRLGCPTEAPLIVLSR